MNKDCRIWRTHEDHWIRVVDQQTTSARTCGRFTSTNHVSKDVWEIHVDEPRQQGRVEDHVGKDTWHNQMMTTVKRKLTHAISTSDVSKLCHFGRIALGFLPRTNVKSPEVPKDEGPKSLSAFDLRYSSEVRTTIRSRRRTCVTLGDLRW
jgi:hypothetical protein